MKFFKGQKAWNKGIKRHWDNPMAFKKGSIPWNKGKEWGEEIKQKISLAKKGKHYSPKTEFKKGNSGYWLGKKRTKETIKKMVDNRKNYRATKKTKRKQSEALRGNKCYRWKGGISLENVKIRTSLEYRYWRKSVFVRDNFTCQKYGIKGGSLVAHHVNNFADFPELRFAVENGVTLSEKAHKEFHRKYGIKNNTKEQLWEFLNS